jgi:hypothetical protein
MKCVKMKPELKCGKCYNKNINSILMKMKVKMRKRMKKRKKNKKKLIKNNNHSLHLQNKKINLLNFLLFMIYMLYLVTLEQHMEDITQHELIM